MRKPLVIAGVCILVLSGLMGLIAACMFTMSQTPPQWIGIMGKLCFLGFIPMSIAGVAVLLVGLIRKPA